MVLYGMNPSLQRLPARFYRSDAVREPVREWLKDLDLEDRKAIGEDLKDVEFSWPIGMPLVRSLGDQLWEVRSRLARGRIVRVIFCVEQGCMVLLPALHEEESHEKDPADAATGYRSGAEAKERDKHMKKRNIGS